MSHETIQASIAEGIIPEMPTVPASVRPLLEQLRQMLKGRVEVHSGVALESSGALNMRISLAGDVIHLEFTDPKPQVDVTFIMTLKRLIDGIKFEQDDVKCEISGFPDLTFPIQK